MLLLFLHKKDLLSYVQEDLSRMLVLLEGSLPLSLRPHLCSITGITAMLIGESYYDMSNYTQSRKFQKLAIAVASEGNNVELEAVAWGRNSFA